MKKRYLTILLALFLAGCAAPAPAQIPATKPPAATTIAPSPALTATADPADTQPAPTVTPPLDAAIRIAASVPDALREQIHLPDGVREIQSGNPFVTLEALTAGRTSPAQVTWVYALVAPFPTVTDGASLDEVRQAWMGTPPESFGKKPLMLSADTRAAFEAIWGPASAQGVQVVEASKLLDTAWSKLPSWAIIPFEALGPRWKVLQVDGMSPLDKSLDVARYPLAISFGLSGDAAVTQALASAPAWLPPSNRDPSKMTVLVMTGTTALTRKIAETMNAKGIAYPDQKIRDWLRGADLTHISNEVPFYQNCPDPARRDPNFCSDPSYIALLEDAGTDVVELTGNHEMDWGSGPFLATLEMYAQKGWAAYGGGKNLDQARQAVKVESNGNHFAFIGCNPAGPAADWATGETPGSASCDFDGMKAEIARLRGEGYLVIATLQHVEVCGFEPHLTQKADSGKLVDSGAVIVSGSQSHCPQAMAFKGDQFIHYGLGNLFFDQMDDTARREFIDRHIFYAGQYISTELLTAELEDYAQPSPMNEKDRGQLLEDAFWASGWVK